MADATFTAVDLSCLPAPDIVEKVDFETILADAVARMRGPTFESRDSDPATKLLQVSPISPSSCASASTMPPAPSCLPMP